MNGLSVAIFGTFYVAIVMNKFFMSHNCAEYVMTTRTKLAGTVEVGVYVTIFIFQIVNSFDIQSPGDASNVISIRCISFLSFIASYTTILHDGGGICKDYFG